MMKLNSNNMKILKYLIDKKGVEFYRSSEVIHSLDVGVNDWVFLKKANLIEKKGINYVISDKGRKVYEENL